MSRGEPHLLVALGCSTEMLCVLAIGIVWPFEMMGSGEAMDELDAVGSRREGGDLLKVLLALVLGAAAVRKHIGKRQAQALTIVAHNVIECLVMKHSTALGFREDSPDICSDDTLTILLAR